MFCKKCGKEIPDLSMYCPECGAAQFGVETSQPELKLEGSEKAKVIIKGYTNMTNAITAVRDLCNIDFVSARKIIGELPAVLFEKLSDETAEAYAEQLCAAGIDAIVEGGTPKPVTDDGEIDPAFDEELDAYEKEQQLIMPAPAEEPVPAEEPEAIEEPELIEEPEPVEEPESVEEPEPAEEPELIEETETALYSEVEKEKPQTDEDFEKEMAAFLAGDH